MDSAWIAAYLQSAPLREMDMADTQRLPVVIDWPETLPHIPTPGPYSRHVASSASDSLFAVIADAITVRESRKHPGDRRTQRLQAIEEG